MNIAICLLLYSLAMLVAGPPLLRELTWHGHAPRFGVAAWLTAIATVLLTWLLAAGMTLRGSQSLDLPASAGGILSGPVARRGGPSITLGVIGAMVALLAAVSSVRLASTVSRMRARARAHAEAVCMVGHRNGDGYVLVDAAEPAAYCVAGRPPRSS